ncbi:MAG: FHA domain-containing protein [Planctomycetia bacterium]|nr:FHA domain-containing protein [Planctomycetia bacterium]
MATLTICGLDAHHFLRETLPLEQPVCIGRAPRNGWAIPWDAHISREHAEVVWNSRELRVRCLDSARNPLLYFGRKVRELTLSPGEEFTIGSTKFTIQPDEESVAGLSSVCEFTFSRSELHQLAFVDAERRLEQLAKLPDLIASGMTSEASAEKLAEFLLSTIRSASIAVVVNVGADPARRDYDRPVFLRSASRAADVRTLPSRTLLRSALQGHCSILHIFNNAADPSVTLSTSLDWAFCVPVSNPGSEGWCLYVSGAFDSNLLGRGPREAADLKGDVKFAELLSEFLGSIRESQQLRRREGAMSQYFSPIVVEALRNQHSDDVLAPREADVTVLFCDVRGFSRRAERARRELHDLLQRIGTALGVMADAIVRHEGIIADFQGDAALGFWGWPTGSSDDPAAACRTALEIAAEFMAAARDSNHVLTDFRVGIGIAHGRAIAGRIGPQQQAKVGVFGPAVNLGGRLETMTKHLRANILIDEATADYVRRTMPPEEARVRRVAKVRPAGMDDPLWIAELLPAANQEGAVSNEQIGLFESAADAVVEGNWSDALKILYELPTHDRVREFLIAYLLEHHAEPPRGWDGVITLKQK